MTATKTDLEESVHCIQLMGCGKITARTMPTVKRISCLKLRRKCKEGAQQDGLLGLVKEEPTKQSAYLSIQH